MACESKSALCRVTARRHDTQRRSAIFAALCLLTALFLLSACTATAVQTVTASEPPAPSLFQRHLDHFGVPLKLTARGKAIVVNIPAFELIAFEDMEPALRSRIIVGAPWHPTPLLETYTTAVRFRPTWRPTPSMVRSGEYQDRLWPPGRKNPLGLAAIRLEPGLLVYLHDTNRRTLFERDNRALSHGCIRVQRWDELVAWVLDMELAEVHRLANGGRTFDRATPPIPVTLGYFTTFPDDSGALLKFDDIYRRGGIAGTGPAPSGNGNPTECTSPAPIG